MSKKTKNRAIKQILGTENKLLIQEEEGIDLELMLHLYHKTGRNKEELNKAIKEVAEMKIFDSIDDLIEDYKESIKTTKELKKSIFTDQIKKRVKND